jgi:hypothetical protein
MRNGNGVVVIRILAVCGAVALGGGYVWQRQKSAAVPTVETPGERPLMPGSKSMMIADEGAAGPGAQLDRPVISGSKSALILRPGEEIKDLIVIPGVPPADEVPPAEAPVRPPRQRTVLPGSKSLSRILESPERKPMDPAPPTEPETVEPQADEP